MMRKAQHEQMEIILQDLIRDDTDEYKLVAQLRACEGIGNQYYRLIQEYMHERSSAA